MKFEEKTLIFLLDVKKGYVKKYSTWKKNYIYTFSKLILFSYTIAFTLIKEVPM